jgi:hypothetical protein
MESTFATEMSESQQAQLNEILDRCLADLQLAHAQLVKEEAQFQQTQAEMAALAARSEREKLDVEQILRAGQVGSPFH